MSGKERSLPLQDTGTAPAVGPWRGRAVTASVPGPAAVTRAGS